MVVDNNNSSNNNSEPEVLVVSEREDRVKDPEELEVRRGLGVLLGHRGLARGLVEIGGEMICRVEWSRNPPIRVVPHQKD